MTVGIFSQCVFVALPLQASVPTPLTTVAETTMSNVSIVRLPPTASEGKKYFIH